MTNIKQSLVIMAAGRSRRFGLPKQLQNVTEKGNWLMDFAVYDALRLGLHQVVFIVSKDQQQIINQHYKPLSQKIQIKTIVQQQNPAGFEKLTRQFARQKPWGTGQAALAAAEMVNQEFVLLNADDFYGFESLKKAVDFLNQPVNSEQHALIAFRLGNTLTTDKPYSRAVCKTNASNYLSGLKEQTSLKRKGQIAVDQNSLEEFPLNSLVSMNCWAFRPSIFKLLEKSFKDFLNENPKAEAEFFLPKVVQDGIHSNQLQVKVLESHEQWVGLTYPDDFGMVQQYLQKLIRQGNYPEALW
jgi:UTP-glucose-1-phosphate uridylyltransferase